MPQQSNEELEPLRAAMAEQTVRMSELGKRFWDACHPSRASLPAR